MSIVESGWKDVKVFVTVKTYPTPSSKYRETVCTAGITEQGEWIRLYPVPFRYLESSKQYPKYSWIHARVRNPNDDNRPDSLRVDADSIRITHIVKPSTKGWSERNGIILPTISDSLDSIIKRESETKQSLGIFKPKQILDMQYKLNTKPGSSRLIRNEFLGQLGLFDEEIPKDLEPMEYNFYFVYQCDSTYCRGIHKTIIIDWEIFALYRRFKKTVSPERAAALVREHYLTQVCGPSRETFFIIGTDKRFNNFMIIGLYWPPAGIGGQVSLLH